jgi:hypothetical protein
MRRLVRLPATVTLRAIIAAFGRFAILLPTPISSTLVHPASGDAVPTQIEYAYR